MSDTNSIIEGFKTEIVRETIEWRRPNDNRESIVAAFCQKVASHRDRYLRKVTGQPMLEREIKDIADGAIERARREGIRVYLPETAPAA